MTDLLTEVAKVDVSNTPLRNRFPWVAWDKNGKPYFKQREGTRD